MTRYGPWREPREETVGLYPGLVVNDGCQTGSITIGRSRLPLWAIIPDYCEGGWDAVLDYEPPGDFTNEDLKHFLVDLLNLRGEFGRLLLVLADAERLEAKRGDLTSWWETKRHRERVADQLRRCLRVVDDEAGPT